MKQSPLLLNVFQEREQVRKILVAQLPARHVCIQWCAVHILAIDDFGAEILQAVSIRLRGSVRILRQHRIKRIVIDWGRIHHLHLHDVLAAVLPDGKVAEVQKLQGQYDKVAFVGDGTNDAPALTQANVGIAIGTDIAIEASDVTLVRGELGGVVEAINLSQTTFRRIKQNLFWALFYNIAMVPLAVIGWMHPVLAEIAMAISSVTVVSNANRPSYAREAGAAPRKSAALKTVETAAIK